MVRVYCLLIRHNLRTLDFVKKLNPALGKEVEEALEKGLYL